jgi:hypothetical protein
MPNDSMLDKIDGEVYGGAILVAFGAPNNFSGLLPSKMTISRFANSEFDRKRLREGMLVATALTSAEAIGAALVFKSWLPLIFTAAVTSVLIWQYEQAIRNPHPENMPINSPNNANSPG